MTRIAVNAILDSAEAQFAQRGYHGVSMRQIAAEAGISVSLAQYHFRTKEALFGAVMERRIVAINHQRLNRLDAVEVDSASTGTVKVADVLRSFLEPTVLLSRDKASGGKCYAQLISQITNDPQPHAQNVSMAFTDPIARQTMRVLHLALPDLDHPTLTWCYVFAVGSMISAISPTGRVRRLSGGRCDPDDVRTIMSLLVPFLTGAFERVQELARAGVLAQAGSLAAVLPLPALAQRSAAPRKAASAPPASRIGKRKVARPAAVEAG